MGRAASYELCPLFTCSIGVNTNMKYAYIFPKGGLVQLEDLFWEEFCGRRKFSKVPDFPTVFKKQSEKKNKFSAGSKEQHLNLNEQKLLCMLGGCPLLNTLLFTLKYF